MRKACNMIILLGASLAVLSQAACAQTPRPAKTSTLSAPLTPGWQHDAVFYLLFVRSFTDSSQGPLANDGIGDLQGIIERLDYLNDGDPTTSTDLGITALWLMPVTQSPSYHGYDTTDYKAINNEYGTKDDMRRLVAECHKRGIRVLVDLVINHTSKHHPWFVESTNPGSEKRDWYRWEDAKPDQKGPWGQPVWHPIDPESDSSPTYYGIFWEGMPDLNYTNPQVTQAMHDIARFWLTDFGVDGFRIDAIKYLIEDGNTLENTPQTVQWLAEFNAFVDSVKPGAFVVGEVWDVSEQISKYIDPPSSHTPASSPAIDSAFDFPFAYAVTEGLRDNNADRIRKDIARSYRLHHNRASPFLSNHDMDRSMPLMGNSIPKAKAAATLLLTAPGSPFIYYGEELGQIGTGDHKNLRTPLQWTTNPENTGFTSATPWLSPHTDTATVSIEAETDDPQSLLSHYRNLIRIRDAHPALRKGDLTLAPVFTPKAPASAEAPEDNGIVAFVRTIADDRVLVIVNATDRVVSDFRIDATSLRLDPATLRTDLITGQPISSPLPNHPDLWRPIPKVLPYASHVIVLDH